MSEEENKQPREDGGYVEAGAGFDHPNVQLMDDQLLLTMNNERIVNGYIKSENIPVVKAEIEVMGAMELLHGGGYNGVDNVRATKAGVFTLERAVEVAENGFGAKLAKSVIDIQMTPQPWKQTGFLHNPFKKQEEPEYFPTERRR